jgi:Rrf2 family protein
MKLTTKARYGLKICYELGRQTDKSLSSSEIALLTGYSVKYIEKLMKCLKKDGIVIAERGAGGGYRLSRPPEQITLGEIIRPLEDNLEIVKCVGGTCQNECHCPSYGVWKKLYNGINNLLDSMTLKEIIDDNDYEGEKYEKGNISGSRRDYKC